MSHDRQKTGSAISASVRSSECSGGLTSSSRGYSSAITSRVESRVSRVANRMCESDTLSIIRPPVPSPTCSRKTLATSWNPW